VNATGASRPPQAASTAARAREGLNRIGIS
jgi:hypothetical protein